MNKILPYVELIRREPKILSAQINLTNRCTSRCKSCRKYTWPDAELNFEVLKLTLLYLKYEGLETVVLSGGEPLLYAYFDKLINFLAKENISYSIITTLIFKDENMIKKIAQTAERIHISLDAVNQEEYHKIRGVNAFSVIENNINLINEHRKHSLEFRASSTISKLNCNSVLDIYHFCAEHKLDLNFYLVHTFDELKMTKSEIDKFKYNMFTIVLNKKNKIKTNAQEMLYNCEHNEIKHNFKRCYIPYIHCLIDADGSIYPCCKLLNDNGFYDYSKKYSYGNIYEDVKEAFGGRLLTSYPINCDLCKECSSRYIEANSCLERELTNCRGLFL